MYGDKYTGPDYTYPSGKKQESNIFQCFLDAFPNEAGKGDEGANWFIHGIAPSYPHNKPLNPAGYFKDVFPEGVRLGTNVGGLSKERFNEVIKDALSTKKAIGLSVGPNAALANLIGQKNRGKINSMVHTILTFGAVLGIALLVIGMMVARRILVASGTPETVLDQALLYIRIYFVGIPFMVAYNFGAAIVRSYGDTRRPMCYLIVSGVLNVILNLLLVIGFHLGVAGVAIATVISNAVSSVILYRRLRKSTQEIHLEPRMLRIDMHSLGQILRIGLPAGVQSALFAVSNIVIQSAINSLGTVVMAASSAAFNIEVITYDILNSFSQACTTFVGQNYGAGDIRRCRRTLLLCLIEGAIALAAAISVILCFGKSLLAIFNNDPEVVATGFIRLMMVMLSHSLSLMYEVMSGYLRGFGISLPPALLTMLGVCGVRIAWIQWVFPQSRTFKTIMTVYPVSLSATALLIFIALLYYRPSRRHAAAQAVSI